MKMTVKVCLSIGTEDLEGAAYDGAAWKAGAPGARYEAAGAGKGGPSPEKGKACAPGARGEAGDAGLRDLPGGYGYRTGAGKGGPSPEKGETRRWARQAERAVRLEDLLDAMRDAARSRGDE